MEKTVVTLVNNAMRFYLVGTTWTTTLARATQFDTVEAARTGLDRAKKFMKVSVWKRAELWALSMAEKE